MMKGEWERLSSASFVFLKQLISKSVVIITLLASSSMEKFSEFVSSIGPGAKGAQYTPPGTAVHHAQTMNSSPGVSFSSSCAQNSDSGPVVPMSSSHGVTNSMIHPPPSSQSDTGNCRILYFSFLIVISCRNIIPEMKAIQKKTFWLS